MRGQRTRSPGWRCPDCARRFIRRTREHSCDVTSVESHLSRTSPEVRRVFHAIVRLLGELGPHEVTPVKTMIVLSRTGNFGGITLTKSRLDLGFFLTHEVHHERIHKIERLGPRKVAHHVRLSSVADVDAQVNLWLTEAYHGDPSEPPVRRSR